jgi:hypothetical protein
MKEVHAPLQRDARHLGKKHDVEVEQRVAIAYDFDGTLAKGKIQKNYFLPNLGISTDQFFSKRWRNYLEKTKWMRFLPVCICC